MKKFACLTLMLVMFMNCAVADDVTFSKVKVTDPKGNQTDARLIFRDDAKTLLIKVADRDFVVIPYEALDKFSYDYTKKHRITEGAIVMVASIGIGGIVMLTKKKSHWLYINFHDQSAAKSIVLRMDKSDYKQIIDAVKAHTGRDVEFLDPKKKKNA